MIMTTSIGPALIEALGLPKGAVTDVELHFPSNGIVTATVELMPSREQLEKVFSIVKRYELRERNESVLDSLQIEIK